MKKFFTLFLTLMTSVMLWAYDFQSGDLYYTITSNVAPYTVEVTSGNTKYSGDITIPSSVTYNGITYAVTSIRSEAFRDCSSLTSVTIPNSVTSIGDRAFSVCSSLTSVTIPNSVTSIGSYAFYYCFSLTSVTIPNSVTSIGGWAFESTGIFNDNSNWENGVLYISNCLVVARGSLSGAYTIKNGTRLIADDAFYGCSSLTSVTIPNSVTSIGSSAFSHCSSLTSVTIPNSVTSIGGSAFESTGIFNDNSNWENGVLYISNCLVDTKDSLSGVYTIKNGTRIIADDAFSGCSSLTSVTIPNSVTSIGNSAFYGCVLPKDKFINNSACTSDNNWGVTLADKEQDGLLIKGNVVVGCKKDITTVTIPNGIVGIGDYAFRDCSSLTSVTIPNSVTSIGSAAFAGCSFLTSVTIPNSVTSIEAWIFQGCSSLTSVTIPNSVTRIEGWAFRDCSSLTSVTIPNSVTSIGSAAFAGCSFLTSVTIPNSVTSIEAWIFQGCSSLTSVTIPNSVTSIADYAFYNCSSLTSVTILNGVMRIGGWAFQGCSSLTSVTIPNSVTSIADYAFYNCSSLTSVTIPNSVTSIGIEAFRDCSSLTSVTIPNSVTSIGGWAFESTGIFNDNSNWENGVLYISNCLVDTKDSLSGVYTIKNGTRLIADDAFYGCSSLTTVTIPSSVTSIGDYAFLSCSSLTSVTIPNSVTSIADYAFYNCSSLTSVTIPNSVTSIGNSAFRNCSFLNTIYVEATTPPALMNSTFAGTPSPVCHIPCGTKAAYEASAWAYEVDEFIEEGCDYGSYSRNVRIGYNTICLPHGSSHFTGATFYEIAHILKNKKKIFFDEVKTLEAGKPYIFYPHSTEVTIYYDNTTSAIPLSHNGLHGTFDGITAASNFLKGKYLVAGDRMVLCGDGCSLAANRAYIELDEISDKDHPAIPGIKRVSMDYSEENATTALDNITDETIVAPIQEGVYDILGRKVDAPTVSGFYIINGKKVFVAL